MFLRNFRSSLIKLILPFFYIIINTLKGKTRVVNFFREKKIDANNHQNFSRQVYDMLKDKKLVGLDVGAQGGFNCDKFFPEKYNKFFTTILVDPLKNSLLNQKSDFIITKALWSSKTKKKLHVLKDRPQSSSLFEPDRESLKFYGYEEKDFNLFNISNTEDVECDTLDTSLKQIKVNTLDYLKIDTQGAELEILKGMGNYRPLMIKCEVQIFPMYKKVPDWTELTNYLYKMDYMLCDWKKIGSHVTRTPAEMDMVFIPNFLKESGRKLIFNNKNQFICLMLISGQIELLKKISEHLNFENKNIFSKIVDEYFN